MFRSTVSLDGDWEFGTDSHGVVDAAALARGGPAPAVLQRSLPVPGAWQAAGGELRNYGGRALYRRTVDLAGDLVGGVGRQVWLHCGAVDYRCRAYVNGAMVGEHSGGFTHFAFDITDAIHAGTNTVVLDVEDTEQSGLRRARRFDDGRSAPGSPGDDQPLRLHGKQEWYLSVSGPWQPVWLESVPAVRLEDVRVTPLVESMEARVHARLSEGTGAGLSLALRVIADDGAGEELAAWTHPLEELGARGESGTIEATVALPGAALWTPGTPHLCRLHLELRRQDEAIDSVETSFGMREFRAHDGHFYLNGQPFFLVAALDQDLYPETIFTPPSREYVEKQFRLAKELGLNCLRCHIKLPDPFYFELADRIGLLIWAEVPSWRTFFTRQTVHPEVSALDDAIRGEVKDTLTQAMLERYNHPSIVIWTIVNEDWGTDVVNSARDRAWLREMYDYAKGLDPTRLVVDNSACLGPWGPNVHVKSDLDDFHLYFAMPDRYDNYIKAVDNFAMRPLWSYTHHGDGERRGDEPLVLSEFGTWGLPTMAALRAGYNLGPAEEPSWFQIGNWWTLGSGDDGGWAQDVEKRFTSYGLDRVFGTFDDFAVATQWYQFEAFKAQIEHLRCHGVMAGYVLTEFTDAYWEANGLLDFCRQPKVYHDDFATFNNDDVVVPNWQILPMGRRDAYWSGETCRVPLLFSHYSRRDATDMTLAWRVAGDDGTEYVGGWTRVPDHVAGHVEPLHDLSFTMPTVTERARRLRLEVALHNGRGEPLARNYWWFWVYPEPARWATPGSAIYLLTPAGAAQPGERRLTPREPLRGIGGDLPAGDRALQAGLAARLHALGYDFVEELGPRTRLAVATVLKAEVLQWVREGGTLLFVANSVASRPSPFLWIGGRADQYSGDWMSNFCWVLPEICRRTAPENPLGFAFKDVMPRHVILGLDQAYQQPENAGGAAWRDVLAGSVEGWIRSPGGFIVRVPYGAGQVVMTTFDFSATAGIEPVGTALFHDLVDYCLRLQSRMDAPGGRAEPLPVS